MPLQWENLPQNKPLHLASCIMHLPISPMMLAVTLERAKAMEDNIQVMAMTALRAAQKFWKMSYQTALYM